VYQWLTVQETAGLLRCSQTCVKHLVKAGFLHGIKGPGERFWRIYNPNIEGQRFIEHYAAKIDRMGLISITEAAGILNVSPKTLATLVQRKTIQSYRMKNVTMFSRQAIRDYLWRRQYPAGSGITRKKVYIKRIVEWFLEYYEAQSKGMQPQPPDDLEPLIDAILKLPEQERRLRLSELFAKTEKAEIVAKIITEQL
jgi:hypothetical protein